MSLKSVILTKPGAHRSERELLDVTGSKTLLNPDGYGNGTTNPRADQITAATISFYFADDSQSLFTDIFNPSTPFPNSTNTSAFLLSTAMNTPQAVFPDGLVNIEFRVDGEWIDPSTGDTVPDAFFSLCRTKEFFYQNVECCVRAAFALVNTATDPCKDELWNKFIYANRQLQGLIDLIDCKKWNQATEVLTHLQDFCSTNKLNCGC